MLNSVFIPVLTETPEAAHGGQAVQVRGVLEGVLRGRGSPPPPQRPHRGEAVPVRRLPQEVPPGDLPEEAQEGVPRQLNGKDMTTGTLPRPLCGSPTTVYQHRWLCFTLNMGLSR